MICSRKILRQNPSRLHLNLAKNTHQDQENGQNNGCLAEAHHLLQKKSTAVAWEKEVNFLNTQKEKKKKKEVVLELLSDCGWEEMEKVGGVFIGGHV